MTDVTSSGLTRIPPMVPENALTPPAVARGPGPYRLWPLLNRGLGRPLRLLGREPGLGRESLLAPAVTELSPALLALPGQAGRVSNPVDGGRLPELLAYFAPHPVTHRAVLRREMRNVFVFANGFCRLGRSYNRNGSPLDLAALGRGPVARLPAARYGMEDRSYQFFGHWLRQFSTALLAEGGQDEDLPFLHRAPDDWPDAPVYERMFGLASPYPQQVFVERFVWYQDFAQGPDKRARYGRMAARLARGLDREPGAASAAQQVAGLSDRIYLRRGRTGARREIANEAALENRLAAEGFMILDRAEHPLPVVLAILRQARIVVSIEGSHVNHVHFFVPPGASVVLLLPSDRFNPGNSIRSAGMGHRAGMVIMERGGAAGTYRIEPGEVLDTIALTEGSSAPIGWQALA